MDAVTPYQALQRMRQLTEAGVPFSFSFESLSTKTNKSYGLKVVNKAILRQGLRDDQSDLSHQLIAYTDLEQKDAPRFFHLSLMMSFNQYTIKVKSNE